MVYTVREIEQEAARRMGPFHLLSVAASPSPTTSLFYAGKIKTSANQGGLDDLQILRRGRKTDGTAVSVVDDDRQRLVQLYDADDGYLQVDRVYAGAPTSGEEAELMLLAPDDELRVATRMGLRRCYFLDRVAVSAATASPERNLTATYSWLTDERQVYDVEYQPSDSTVPPAPIVWWETIRKGSALWLKAIPDPTPLSLLLTVLRPFSSLVNLIEPPIATVADVVVDGSLAANTRFWVAVAAHGAYGRGLAYQTSIVTANDGNATHLLRVTIPQVSGATSYTLYASTTRPARRVATVTEAQRAAGGVIVTGVDALFLTGPNPAGTVDVDAQGATTTAVLDGPSGDDDVFDIDLEYAAAAVHIEAWRRFGPRLAPVTTGERPLYPKLEAVAEEFTRQASMHVQLPQRRLIPAYPRTFAMPERA